MTNYVHKIKNMLNVVRLMHKIRNSPNGHLRFLQHCLYHVTITEYYIFKCMLENINVGWGSTCQEMHISF